MKEKTHSSAERAAYAKYKRKQKVNNEHAVSIESFLGESDKLILNADGSVPNTLIDAAINDNTPTTYAEARQAKTLLDAAELDVEKHFPAMRAINELAPLILTNGATAVAGSVAYTKAKKQLEEKERKEKAAEEGRKAARQMRADFYDEIDREEDILLEVDLEDDDFDEIFEALDLDDEEDDEGIDEESYTDRSNNFGRKTFSTLNSQITAGSMKAMYDPAKDPTFIHKKINEEGKEEIDPVGLVMGIGFTVVIIIVAVIIL